MNAIARSLAVATALAATPALAHESRPLPPAPVVVTVQAPLPWADPRLAPPYAEPLQAGPPAPAPLLVPGEWAPRYGEWAPRHGGQFRALQAEYRFLERARERFYAFWRGNPWAQRRFEGWYASRRAELDQRQAWLAERREHRGHGRFAWNGGEHDDD